MPARLPRWQQQPRRPIRALLALLDRAEIPHQRLDAPLWHADRCPACWCVGLYVNNDHSGPVGVACWSECAADDILAALKGVRS
jgi:hypothetical protein